MAKRTDLVEIPARTQTILIIEDDRSLQTILSSALRVKGYQLLIADDGELGLELALSSHPDLILLDLQLPKLNGHDILERLREHEHAKRIPVIVLTNDESPRAVQATLNKAAPAYFVKAETSLEAILKAVYYHLV